MKGPFHPIFVHNGTNKALNRVGREIGLVKYIVVQHGEPSDRLVATTMEALIAVIYLDCKKNVGVVKASMAAMGLKARAE